MAKLAEVFGVSREVPLNYTVRESADTVLLEALAEQKHIVIHGSSKQGKTNLWKNTLNPSDYLRVTCLNTWSLHNVHEAVLKAAGYKVEGSASRTVSGGAAVHVELQAKVGLPLVGKAGAKGSGDLTGAISKTTTEGKSLDLDLGDVNDIILALTSADAPPYIILDDFHYLPPDTQENFSVALKAFHEASSYTFVVVGVWLEENRLLQHNGDLSGRSVSINADHWSPTELREVITAGEDLLKVKFTEPFINGLIDAANESVWIVQEVCNRACKSARVFETQESVVHIDGDVRAIVTEVVDQESARYRGLLSRFVDGFQDTRLEMYKWIAYAALTATKEQLDKGLSLGRISNVINDHHPERPINPGNITQALKSTASLQATKLKVKPIVLDYDETDRRLTVVDRTFLLWFEFQDKDLLLSDLGLTA